jgi:hypothetical protein
MHVHCFDSLATNDDLAAGLGLHIARPAAGTTGGADVTANEG